MKILVINGHPDSKSFSAAIFEKFVENLDKNKHEIETLELGKMNFDPVLRYGYREFMAKDEEIEKSQKLIRWADHLVFIYPIWWSGMPSLLKGWIERVFTPGIAYSSNTKGNFLLNFMTGNQFKKLLKGKTAEVIATSMGPSWWYKIFSGIVSVPDSYGVLRASTEPVGLDDQAHRLGTDRACLCGRHRGQRGRQDDEDERDKTT